MSREAEGESGTPAPGTADNPRFFPTPADMRVWFQENHHRVDELWVGYYKKGTGLPSVTWPESVDEALCFGWIDGIRKSIDDRSYRIRFTPRRKGSHWSARNLGRMKHLAEAGLVADAGLAAYERRDRRKEKQASYEQGKAVSLPPEYEARIRANAAAWEYFRAARPSYRKQVTWWVVSAKREDTRLRRLGILIESSAEGTVIPAMRWAVRK